MYHSTLTDNELVSLLKTGDELALSCIYLRYWDKLLAVATNRLDNQAEAEEIVQDIFINIWDRRKEIELRHSLGTYLAVAVKYRVINLMDKQHRQRLREESTLLNIAHSISPEELVLEKELMARLETCILQLPEKCRLVYRMSREDGKTYKQIAEALNISESTVEKHIIKALKGIRSQISTTSAFTVICLLERYL